MLWNKNNLKKKTNKNNSLLKFLESVIPRGTLLLRGSKYKIRLSPTEQMY